MLNVIACPIDAKSIMPRTNLLKLSLHSLEVSNETDIQFRCFVYEIPQISTKYFQNCTLALLPKANSISRRISASLIRSLNVTRQNQISRRWHFSFGFFAFSLLL